MNCKLLITGDFCPIGRNISNIENNNNSIFDTMIPFLNEVDFAVTNLETPLTFSENKIQKTGPNIKGNPNAANMLSEVGFNLVTMANNHILDYGEQGISDTIKYCNKANINYIGVGKNMHEAREPFITIINDVSIGFLNFAENEFCAATENTCGANPVNLINNHQDIKQTKEKVDYLIVIVHGGREHYQLPTPQQRDRYRFYIDSGADIVVGHHTHCYSGYEIYKEKPVFYSLGNFIFDYKKKYQTGLWTQGYAVMFSLNQNNIKFDIVPYNQGRKEDPKLQLMNDEELNIFNENITKLNNIIINDDLFRLEWKKYLTTQKKDYKGMLFIQNKYIRVAVTKGLLPVIFPHSKSHQLLLLNLIRCESHREIITNILENDLE